MGERRGNDDQYKRDLQDRFQSLREEDRQKVVACIPRESCRILAERLLQNDEMTAALNRQDVSYPAAEIVDVWARKGGSTIYVLKDTLEKLHLEVAVEALEKAREDPVSLHTRIAGVFRTFTVPSKKPLLEIIRPFIHRQQCVPSKPAIRVIQLVRKNDRERDKPILWSSPAKDFKGQQVNISVEEKKSEEVQRHTDKPRNLDEPFRVDRNAISVIEEDRLFFEYDDDDGDDETLSSKMADASVAEIYNRDEGKRGNLKGSDDNPESVICQCVDLSSEDTLKDHLTAEGDFVVQQIQSEGQSTLNLSVRHGTHILRYPIMTQCDNGLQQFSISGADHSSTDVQQLLNHYHTGGHCLPLLPSLPPTQVEDDPVYLKRYRNTSTDCPR